MALIIEDGTGKADGESWATLEDTDAYWEARQQTRWTEADPDDREAQLRIAADYLMLAYRWPGQPTTIGQRLPWPRSGVRSGAGYFPANAIPTQIVSAQMILAVEGLTTPLLQKRVGERQVIEETKAAKGFSKTLKYQAAPVDDLSGLPRFPQIDVLLRGVAEVQSGATFGTARLVKTL